MANDLSAFDAQLWSKALVLNLDQINVMVGKTNRQWEGLLNNVGDTVQVRTLGSVSTFPYSKGVTTITYQDLSPTKEPLTVSDSQGFAFKVDDIDEIQNDLSALMLYGKRAAVAVNNVIEAKIQSAYTGALAANQITNAGAAITLDSSITANVGIYPVLVQARQNLAVQNVPVEGRWAVLDPKTISLLLNDTAHFIRATILGDGVVKMGTLDGQAQAEPGLMGMCAGFKIYESNAVPIVGGAKYMIYGDNDAIAYVSQLKTIETLRLETQFDTAVRGLLLHDIKVFAEASKRLGYIKATP